MTSTDTSQQTTPSDIQELAARIRTEVAKAVVGQDDTVDLLLTALFSGGHVLLEGPPGTAKTFLARCFAATLALDYGRIQFTPDLMPGDVVGTNIFNFQSGEFTLTKGPIFSDVLLADEINRTPPKTQAALLEAMQERRVTIDGDSLSLGDHFLVIATQNPIEQQGIYPLPEAQLDRFMFKHLVNYPSLEEERAIVASHGNRTGMGTPDSYGVSAILTPDGLSSAIKAVGAIRLDDSLVAYIVDLVRATRDTPAIETGASPRAASALALAARAKAVLDGRDYVIPDDVKHLALPTLRHRLSLSPAAEIEGRSVEDTLAALIDQTAAPR